MSEVARLPDREPDSLLGLISRAVRDPEFDVAKLKELLAMQRELVHEQRRLEFNAAMGRAQGRMRAVVRDARNTQTNSRYARLESIDDEIRPIYTEEGFSLTFGTTAPTVPGNIRVTCRCAHSAGHVEEYELEAPPDMTGARGQVNKTALHAMGSTISYLRRYLTTMIFNVVLVTEDDDGNAGGGNVRDIADGMGENARREPPRQRQEQRRPTVAEWLGGFEIAASGLQSAEEADRLITGPQSLWAKDNAKGEAKARYDAVIANVMRAWFPPAGDGPSPAGDAPSPNWASIWSAASGGSTGPQT